MLRFLISAALAALLAVSAGCGDDNDGSAPAADRAPTTSAQSGPLAGVLSAEQIAQLERSIADQLNLGASPDAAPSREAVAQVRSSCEALDESVPMLAASKAGCEPGLELFEASVAFANACVAGTDGCADALRQLGDAAPGFRDATLEFHGAVAEAVDDPRCRDQLGGTAEQLQAVRKLPDAADAAADAAEAGIDTPAFADAMTRLATVLTESAGTTDPVEYMRTLREVCGLPDATPVRGLASPA